MRIHFPIWAAFIFWITADAAAADNEGGLAFFEKRIRPVLAEHCYECHSVDAKKLKGKLRLDSTEGILLGGASGPALVSGKPDESALITAIRYQDKDLQMPPPKGESARKLSDAVIGDFVEWVKAGAPMPSAGTAAPVAGKSSKSHWAFIPPKEPMLPAVQESKWIQTPIDRFVLARLEAQKTPHAAPANKQTLIRRATFDLTGLAPTEAEVEAFVADQSPDAFARVVDRLLASPRYGERWARHWLDVARYSDSKGYVYGREERFFVHAWAYRDWVVRAFNDDLPYDRFLLLQIAGDQIAPAGSPDLAAMGFITGGRRFLGVSRDIIDDRIDVVTRGTMALTVSCARCHDHKYDPIPTRDYYSLYGVFDASIDRLVRIGAEPKDEAYVKAAKKLADTMKQRREEAEARLRARVGDYLVAQLELHKYPEEGFDQLLGKEDVIPQSVRRWRDFLLRSSRKFDPTFAPWNALAKISTNDFLAEAAPALQKLLKENGQLLNPLVAAAFATPPGSMREAAERYGKLFAEAPKAGADGEALTKFLIDLNSPTTVPDTGIINNEWFFPTTITEELWKLQGDVDRWLIKNDPTPEALALFDREPERNPRVFIRGNPARPGDEVPRQFPEVVAGPARAPFSHGSGRLEMARAIVRPENPLTARVMVNRIWQEHFGAGLVRTASDFGLRAEPPSHPELLDWLALEFIKSGWKIKSLHRLIMLSSTYQQASEPAPALDPENRLLSHFPRARLDFEEMRDAMLAASGELEPKIGGKAKELFAAGNKRRTLYGLIDRQFLPATFRVFDFANPDIHTAQRHATTIPQQALFFLNSPFVADRAKQLAAESRSMPPSERVESLYKSIYQRSPTKSEKKLALQFISEAQEEMKNSTPPPKPVESAWQYGWGEYDAATKRLKSFQPLPHFTGKAWQGGPAYPDGALGWVQLTAEGGHPGNDLKHAVVRRWIAPSDGAVTISGELKHEPEVGDGIRAFIISSHHGELKSAMAHHSRVEMTAPSIAVTKGDTIDFVVDIREELNSDQFLWAPTIAVFGPNSALKWDAQKDFAGPSPKQSDLLAPWAQYAQTLLLANEFSFID